MWQGEGGTVKRSIEVQGNLSEVRENFSEVGANLSEVQTNLSEVRTNLSEADRHHDKSYLYTRH